MAGSSEDDAVSAVISGLLGARRTGKPFSAGVLQGAGLSTEQAYRVQAGVARRFGPVGGFKVANKPDAPRIMAPIFAGDIGESPARIDVPAGEPVGIELEVGFRVEAPLPPLDLAGRRAAVAKCLSAVAAIEIVRTRLADPASPAMKLADNQINGGLVLGAPVRDWQALPVGQVEAFLSLGADVVLDGKAAVPGGDAFDNFLVLEAMVGTHCGGLQPGQVVITGSLNGLPYVSADIAVRGRVAGLGAVSVELCRIG